MLKRKFKVSILALAILLFCTSNAMALIINHGTKVMAVDGDNDSDVSVTIQSQDVWDGYYLKYSVNNSAWEDVSDWGGDTFTGGDIIDFALVGSGNCGTDDDEFYILSNDLNDDSFSAVMNFFEEMDSSNAQQPQLSTPYFKDLLVKWDINSSGTTFSNSFTLSWCGSGDNDGVAPVPEPATMLLFGVGLIGIAGVTRRKMNLKAPRD